MVELYQQTVSSNKQDDSVTRLKEAESLVNKQTFPEMYSEDNLITHGVASTMSNNGLEILLKDTYNILHLYHDMFLRCDNNVDRKRIIDMIIPEIWKHTNLEEAVLYPLSIWALRHKSILTENIPEIEMIQSHLEMLEGMDVHDVQFMDQCKLLMTDFEIHAKKEETQLFPKLMHHLNSEQLDLLYQCLGCARTLAPNRRVNPNPDLTLPHWIDHQSVLVAFDELLQSLGHPGPVVRGRDALKVNPWNMEH